MKTKRLLLVSGLGIGALLTFCVLFKLDNIPDTVVALCNPPVYQRLHATPIDNFVVSANLAKQCLESDYTPEMVLALAPLYTKLNPNRANELLNMALAHTAAGISSRSAFDIMLQLANLRLHQKRYSEAESYVKSALKLRCSNDLQGAPDDRISCLWILSDIEKDQRHYDAAEKYLEEATELSYGYLPASPCMQENLAVLLEQRAVLKTLKRLPDQAANLCMRATLTRRAMSQNTVSPMEMPFILAARVKYEKACKAAGLNVEADESTQTATQPAPSKELLAELRQLRFPASCQRTDKELESSPKSSDGVDLNTVVACSPFGPLAGPRQFGEDNQVTSKDGELFTFNMQHDSATIAKGETCESIHCEPPQVWWACTGMNVDKANNRLIAVSNDGNEAAFFEKPIYDSQEWTALASLSNQGVKNAYGLFFGPENDLYTFDRDTNLRIIALVRLTYDGTVRSITKFPAPIAVSTGYKVTIARCGDKIVVAQPDGVASDDNGNMCSSGSSWVLDLKGKILACIPLDTPVTVSSDRIDQ